MHQFQGNVRSSQDTQSGLLKVVAELQKAEVFKVIPNRAHPSFPNEKPDIFNDFDVKGFHQWLCAKKTEYAGGKKTF